MVTPGLQAHFRDRGVTMVSLAEGARRFVEELRASPSQSVEVLVGGMLNQPSATASRRVEILVSAQTHPYLASHAIQGVPVVPVVLVHEWFVRAASTCHPGLTVQSCGDLTVLRGIRLKQFDGPGDRFEIRCTAGDLPGQMKVELRGADSTLHYKATMMIGDHLPSAPLVPVLPREESTTWPWSIAEAYDQHLFHGADFQVLADLGDLTTGGATGTLETNVTISWPADHWMTEAAALDGGLQLAQLWALHSLGRLSLPTRAQQITRYQRPTGGGQLACLLHCRVAVGGLRTSNDIYLLDQAGNLVLSALGVDMHLVDGGLGA